MGSDSGSADTSTSASGTFESGSPSTSSDVPSNPSTTGSPGTTAGADTTTTTGTGSTTDGPLLEEGAESDGCGDGHIGPHTECDGENLDGFDCIDLGYRGGVLACNPASCRFDTSMCIGDGPLEGPGESPIESSSSAGEGSSTSAGGSSSAGESSSSLGAQ